MKPRNAASALGCASGESLCAENLHRILSEPVIRKTLNGFFAHLPLRQMAQAQAFATSVAVAMNFQINLDHAVVRPPNEANGYAADGSLPKTGWKKLEEQMFGVPFYRRRS